MEKSDRIGDEYITSDLMEVAYLSTKGLNYTVNKSNTKSVMFIFMDAHGLIEKLLFDFRAGSKEHRLLNTYREVKKIAVFDGYKRGHYRNG